MTALSIANKTNTKSLLVIDRTLVNHEQFAAGAVAGAEVIILDSNRDGIEQITEVFSENPHLEAIHLLCHGSPGCLHLGNSHLGLDNLDEYASLLQTWGNLLTPRAQALRRGCLWRKPPEFIRPVPPLHNSSLRL